MTDDQLANFIQTQVNKQSEWQELYFKQQKQKRAQRAIDKKDDFKKANDKYRASLKGV